MAAIVLAVHPLHASHLPAHITAVLNPLFQKYRALRSVLSPLFIAAVIAAIANAFLFAPRKAWGCIYPLVLKLEKSMQPPEPATETRERHTVYATIKNRSSLESLRCRVAVTAIRGTNTFPLPWYIYTNNVTPNEKVRIVIANWFRDHGTSGGEIRIQNEMPGGYAENTFLLLPQIGTDLQLTLSAGSHPKTEVWCRLAIRDARLHLTPLMMGES
jgi:hypothetical protein